MKKLFYLYIKAFIAFVFSMTGFYLAKTLIHIFPLLIPYCDFVFCLFEAISFTVCFLHLEKKSTFYQVFAVSYTYFLIDNCLFIGQCFNLTTEAILTRIFLGIINAAVLLAGFHLFTKKGCLKAVSPDS